MKVFRLYKVFEISVLSPVAEQLAGAVAGLGVRVGVRRVFAGRPVHQAVGVGGRLPIAEVGRVSAAPDAPRHPRLLDGLADEDAVLLELLREDGVEEWVAARVERQHEHREHLPWHSSVTQTVKITQPTEKHVSKVFPARSSFILKGC